MDILEELVGSVLIAHASDDTRKDIAEALPDSVSVAAECRTCEELAHHYAGIDDGLVISGVAFPDGDGIETLARLGSENPHPAVVVTPRRSLEIVERATRDHVMAYLIEPLDPRELLAAMVLAKQRGDQLVELRNEVKDLQQALSDRRVIEQAKGVLMTARQIPEHEAYAWLRRSAQERRTRIIDVARETLAQQLQDNR